MKNLCNIIKLLRCLMVVITIITNTPFVTAQNSFAVKFQAFYRNDDGKVESVPVYYERFNNKQQASLAKEKIESLQVQAEEAGMDLMKIQTQLDAAQDKLKNKESNSTGEFKVTSCIPGDCILVAYDNGGSFQFKIAEVTENMPEKTYLYFGKEASKEKGVKSDMTKTTHTIKQVDVNEKYQMKMGGSPRPPRAKGPWMYPEIEYRIDKENWNENCRAVFQNVIIDCEAKDTMYAMQPIVFEGKKYHELQTKLKRYDYDKNEDLSLFYEGDLPFDSVQNCYYVYRTQKFRKPDPNKLYGNIIYIYIEDKTHAILVDTIQPICREQKFERLLNYTVSNLDMPLYREFYQTAEAKEQNVDRKLNIRFETGKWDFVNDEANNKELTDLGQELSSYGQNLRVIYITGSASPEGNYERNRILADKRRDVARDKVKRLVGNVCSVLTNPSRVHSWEECVDSLNMRGFPEWANTMSEIIKNTDQSDMMRAVSSHPMYEGAVKSILENMRVMTCQYAYQVEKVMTQDEVVADYYANKDSYKSGAKPFLYSDGDLYNLYKGITDKEDIDLITKLAYNRISKEENFVEAHIMAPYIANKKAMIDMSNGVASISTLAPFVDKGHPVEFPRRRGSSTRTLNHSAILINYALIALSQSRTDLADTIVRWVRSVPEGAGNPERLDRIKQAKKDIETIGKYLDFIELEGCTAEELQDGEAQKLADAREVVFSNPENKAVMYALMPDNYGVTAQAAESMVDQMSDDNPKKWYLKGIIWSRKSDPKDNVIEKSAVNDTIFRLLTEEEEEKLNLDNYDAWVKYMQERNDRYPDGEGLEEARAQLAPKSVSNTINTDDIPFFLAYFHHCFKMEGKKYIPFYTSEGFLDRDVINSKKARVHYKKKKIAAYEALFDKINE